MMVSMEAPVTDATRNHYNKEDKPDLKRQIWRVSSHKQNLKLKLYMSGGTHLYTCVIIGPDMRKATT